MIKKTAAASLAALVLFQLVSCHSGAGADQASKAADSVRIAAGKNTFNQYCAGCHGFKQDGIGPRLDGITGQVSADWFRRFIRNPAQMLAAHDARAVQLFSRYKIAMPSFDSLGEGRADALYRFLQTQHATHRYSNKNYGVEVKDPFPARIPVSGLVVNLKEFARIPPSSTGGRPPLARITKLDFQPGTGRLFVVDLRGILYRIQPNGQATPYLNMIKERPKFIAEPGLATGFGSFAFHPGFQQNGIFYTTHTEAPGSAKADFAYADSIKVTVQWVLTEWKADNPEAPVFSGTSRELLRVNMVAGIHGVQEIAFNPLAKPGGRDYGMLYLGVGDGGSVENGYPFLPHNPRTIWGTVLRIDPAGRNSANGRYGIPADNPFVADHPGARLGEVYAFGFRNPHRISWTQSGDMLVCNIGQTNIESVNLVRPGNDFGWPLREGPFVLDPDGDLNNIYPLPANDSLNHFSYPVAAFDHDEGHAICGGLEYQGKDLPALKGKYLFADIPSGRLFYIEMAGLRPGRLAAIREWKAVQNGVPVSFRSLVGDGRVDIHFGRDAQGELYILTKANGVIYKLVAH